MINSGKEKIRLVRALQKAYAAFIKSMKEDGYAVDNSVGGYNFILELNENKLRQVGEVKVSWRIFASIDKK